MDVGQGSQAELVAIIELGDVFERYVGQVRTNQFFEGGQRRFLQGDV